MRRFKTINQNRNQQKKIINKFYSKKNEKIKKSKEQKNELKMIIE